MLKSIKIPEEAYKEAKMLSKELEKDGEFRGIYNVPISAAISYAIKKTADDIRRRKAFRKAAGSWKDIDAEKLIKEIYEDRKKGTRWDISLD